MAQVTDYTIDNGTGSAVRTDLNNVFAAIQSLNSGSADPSGTQVAFQLSVNTTSNLLKIRNAANNGYIEIGNVTQANLGLAPVAGATFTGDVIDNYTTALQIPVGTTAQNIKVSQLGYTASLQRRTEQGNVIASGAGAKAVTFTNPFFVGTSSLLGANTNLPSVGINAQNMASGDFFEVSSISGTGFTVHFKNSSNASIDRNFTYQAVGFGKGG